VSEPLREMRNDPVLRQVMRGAYVDRRGIIRMIPRGRFRRLWMRLTAKDVYP
jgi:hypothetical protein